MKKLLVSALALMLALTMLVPAFASSLGTFNLSAYENLPGYDYDKFDKTWTYYRAWSKEYSDAYVVIGMQAEGTSTGVDFVQIYAWIRDQNNRNVLYTIESLDIMVGDNMYTVQMAAGDSSSFTVLGDGAKNMIEDMAKAYSISIRITTDRNRMTYDISGTDYTSTLKAAAKTFYDNHTIDFALMGDSASTIRFYELLYPITES